jgi:DNA-binding protein HU-beta
VSKVNKSQFIDAVAKYADIPKMDAEKAVNAFIDTVSEQLAKGNSIGLTGFGTFSPKERKERKGRNPKTGEEIKIASAKVPNFKPGKTLKDMINQ